MGKYKIQARIIIVVIVVLVVLTGIVFHDVPLNGDDINKVYRDNVGKIWLITGVGTIVFSLLMYYVLMNSNMLEGFLKTIDSKNDIIKAQSDQIIATLEYNAKRHDELMTKLNENTEKDLKVARQVVNLEKIVIDHESRIKKLERS